MPQLAPGSNQQSLRPDIGLAMEEYDLEAEMAGFVWEDILPVIEVDKPEGHYPYKEIKDQKSGSSGGNQLGPNNSAGGIDDRRQQDGTFRNIESGFTTKPYRVTEHGLQQRVDRRNAAAYDDYFDLEMDAAMNVKFTVCENQNRRVIDMVTNDNRITNQAGTSWEDPTADVIGQVRTGLLAIRARVGRIGMTVNTNDVKMVIDLATFLHLKSNNGILAAYIGASDRSQESIDLNAMARALNVGSIRVSDTMQNDAGQPLEASLSEMWPRDKALLTVCSTNRRKARLGNTFHYGWDGSEVGGVFQTWFDEESDSDKVRSRLDADP